MTPRQVPNANARHRRFRHHLGAKRRAVRPPPIGHDLDPRRRLATCGCHCGSFMLTVAHARYMSRRRLPKQDGRQRRLTASRTCRCGRFNVAAAARLRKSSASDSDKATWLMLQCGRSSKAAEIARGADAGIAPPPASMWPQQQGCGNCPICAARRNHRLRASMWPQQQGYGNRRPADPFVQRPCASMWPQQQGCGNPASGTKNVTVITRLQCGRSSKAAEMGLPTCRFVSRGSASMWPQQQGCGNTGGRSGRQPSRCRFNVAAAARLRKFRAAPCPR